MRRMRRGSEEKGGVYVLIKIYARMNAESYGAWVIKASSALLSSVQSHNLPVIDDEATARVLRSLQGMDWANTD